MDSEESFELTMEDDAQDQITNDITSTMLSTQVQDGSVESHDTSLPSKLQIMDNHDEACSVAGDETTAKQHTIWEYEVKRGHWVRYGRDVSDKLNQAACDEVVKVEIDESPLELDLNIMKQINMVSGFQRPIRCAVFAKDEDGVERAFVWEGQLNGRLYAPLPLKASLDLEKSWKGDGAAQVDVKLRGELYTAYLDVMKLSKKMGQGGDTDEERAEPIKLRRTESKAVASMMDSPVPRANVSRNLPRRSSAAVPSKEDRAKLQNIDPRDLIKVEVKNEEDTAATPTPRGRKRSRQSVKKEEPEEEEENEVDDDEILAELPSAKKKSRASKSSKAKSSVKSVPKSQFDGGRKRFLLKAGVAAPVDPECTEKVDTAYVYSEGATVYDAMLNQTNIANNNNKYYILQVLKDEDTERYSVWFRWGRVGYRGQSSLIECGTERDEAIKLFTKKFWDKTMNEWGDRENFKPVPGKYTLIKMDYSVKRAKEEQQEEEEAAKENAGTDAEQKKKLKVESKLDERVQRLIRLICDVRMMEETVLELEFDSTRSPLGKLTQEQVREGYELLHKIEMFIQAKDWSKAFVEAVNEYYTKIPHYFGFKQPPLIKTKDALTKETELLEVLSDIEIAMRQLGNEKHKEGVHPLDQHYDGMRCEVRPVREDEKEYKMIETYLKETHASTHQYTMTLKNVFELRREGEDDSFKKDLGNRLVQAYLMEI